MRKNLKMTDDQILDHFNQIIHCLLLLKEFTNVVKMVDYCYSKFDMFILIEKVEGVSLEEIFFVRD